MKKMMKNILLLLVTTLFVGCNGFLDESSQDEVRPSQVSDLEQLLVGEGYQEHQIFTTEIYTDELQSNGVTDTKYQSTQNANRYYFRWDKNMFTEEAGGGGAHWVNAYKCILGCNIVLDNIDKMGGDNNLRENIRGEALVLRAWYYLHLVNLFGVAYNQGNPDEELGVPLKLSSEISVEYMRRNNVRQVYAQIEKDLLTGIKLLEEHKIERNFFRINHLAAKAILDRVYLYEQEWDKVIEYANAILNEHGKLLNLNNIADQSGGNGQLFHTVYSTDTPDEILWARPLQEHHVVVSWNSKPPFTSSEKMPYDSDRVSYEQGNIRDLRSVYYFKWEDTWDMSSGTLGYYKHYRNKGNQSFGDLQGIRTAEVYLNRAEAYARKYEAGGDHANLQLALNDLNELRRHRYATGTFTELQSTDFRDAKELLSFCIEERFRELHGETNNRWCDLRRCGLTVTHDFLDEKTVQTFTNDMSRYVLPIPQVALEEDKLLIQNP